mgnify:CR=1 FL=1
MLRCSAHAGTFLFGGKERKALDLAQEAISNLEQQKREDVSTYGVFTAQSWGQSHTRTRSWYLWTLCYQSPYVILSIFTFYYNLLRESTLKASKSSWPKSRAVKHWGRIVQSQFQFFRNQSFRDSTATRRVNDSTWFSYQCWITF